MVAKLNLKANLELLKEWELIEIVENQSKQLVTATNILEMVLLGASDLIDYLDKPISNKKSDLKTADYKRIKGHIKGGYKFIRKYFNR